jgi:Ribbon-helix-helix protein, copG family
VNFNVYLDDDSGKELARIAKTAGKPRNALIRQAVHAWLAEQGKRWPKEVMEFPGDPSVEPFEAQRANLLAPLDDPFEARPHRRASAKRRPRER